MFTTTNPVSQPSQPAQTIEIEYDENDFVTQPYVIMVNGREWMRFPSYASAEGAIAWHTKNGTLPQWELVEEKESLVYSHISQESNGDIEKEVYAYNLDGNFVCFIEVDLYSGEWFNGDGRKYSEWQDAGRYFKKQITECPSPGLCAQTGVCQFGCS